MIDATLIVIPVLIVLLAPIVFSMIVLTGQETVRMIETFGKYSATAEAGLSFKLPWPLQSASGEFSLQQLQLSESVNVKSKDNAFVEVPIHLQYRVDPARARDAFYKLASPQSQIRSYIVNQVRSTASGLTFDELFQSKDMFEADVEETLKDRMSKFGYVMVNILVDDPQPSDDLRESFDRVIASKRLREAAENEAEAERVLAVAKAEAEGEALEIKGRSYSAFRKTVAEGNAEALKQFCGETGLKPADGLSFFNSINEMEAVRDAAASGGRVVFVSGSAKGGTNSEMMGLLAGMDDSGAKPAPSKGKTRPAKAQAAGEA